MPPVVGIKARFGFFLVIALLFERDPLFGSNQSAQFLVRQNRIDHAAAFVCASSFLATHGSDKDRLRVRESVL